jgi:hypothetical protein
MNPHHKGFLSPKERGWMICYNGKLTWRTNMKKIPRPHPDDFKRTNKRVVMVKSIKGRILNSVHGDDFRAQLVNVSSTGAQIYSNKSLVDKTALRLELDSLDGSHTMTFPGTVVWSRKNPMKTMGRFAYGINFDKPTTDHVSFLEKHYSLSSVPEE